MREYLMRMDGEDVQEFSDRMITVFCQQITHNSTNGSLASDQFKLKNENFMKQASRVNGDGQEHTGVIQPRTQHSMVSPLSLNTMSENQQISQKDIFNRLYSENVKKRESLMRSQERFRDLELSKCTFKPSINASSNKKDRSVSKENQQQHQQQFHTFQHKDQQPPYKQLRVL